MHKLFTRDFRILLTGILCCTLVLLPLGFDREIFLYELLKIFMLSLLEFYLVYSILALFNHNLTSRICNGFITFIFLIAYASQAYSLKFASVFIPKSVFGNSEDHMLLHRKTMFSYILVVLIFWITILIATKFKYQRTSILRIRGLSLLGFCCFMPGVIQFYIYSDFFDTKLDSNRPPFIALMTSYSATTIPYKLIFTEASTNSKFDEPHYPFLKDQIFIDGASDDVPHDESSIKNVIVIFGEGMSARLISGYGGRHEGLTPNIDALMAKSLVFDNYFNHTAATFRGIHGQLTSSFNLMEKLNANEGEYWKDISASNCVSYQSLPAILSGYGFKSSFLHPEVDNNNFDKMLNTLGFDEVLSSQKIAANFLADGGNFRDQLRYYLTDQDMINGLIGKLKATGASTERQFFALYNFGTHAFLAPDPNAVRYVDDNNPVLNRLHNFDFHLGRFMDFLEKSSFRDNTLLVLTADHTAYPEPPLLAACSGLGCSKFFIDKIPLLVYRSGKNQPRRIDAQGRNSLDFAPTLLQILGIKNHPNSFLGTTLFERKANSEVNVSMVGRAPFKTDSDTVIAVPTVGTSVDGWGRPAVLAAGFPALPPARQAPLLLGQPTPCCAGKCLAI